MFPSSNWRDTVSLSSSHRPGHSFMRVRLKSFVLLTIIIIAGLAGLPRSISLGPVSLQALLTVGYVLAAWILWFIRPVLTLTVLRSVWLFVLFILWTVVSLFWYKFTNSGFQNILVVTAFTGLILLAASVSRYGYKFQLRVGKTVGLATWIASGIYGSSAVVWGLGSKFISPRAFAAAALLGVAWYLSNWRYGSRKNLWWAGAIIVVMIASLSRMASTLALLLLPLSQLSLKNVRRWLQVVLLVGLAIVTFNLAVTHVEPLRDRFFEGDTKLQVGGAAINVAGRENYWQTAWDSYTESPWIGHGGGSAQELMSLSTAGQVTHPHNDYLRILHDYGAIGLGIWLLGYINLLWSTWKFWIMADRRRDPSAPLYLTAFLSLLAVALVMITDNVMVYINVMAPLGILVGAALGRKPG
jgi:O-antigen ligase